MVMLRGSFSDLFFTDALPVLDEVTMEKYKSYPDMLPNVFNMKTSERWGEQSDSISGFGLVPAKAENANTVMDDVLQGRDKTYTHTTYSLGYRISKEFIDDDRMGIVQKCQSALSRSMFNTRQISGASVINTGFATNGPDGVPLFSTLHPLLGGGVTSNTLAAAADLSVTSLRQALNDWADLVDDRGLLLNLTAKTLLIPNELIWDGEELLKSSLRPDNAQNAVNAFQITSLNYMAWNYITDADSWYLLADKSEHSLTWWEREAVNFKSHYDDLADASISKVRNRFSYGYDEFRGTFGSPGV